MLNPLFSLFQLLLYLICIYDTKQHLLLEKAKIIKEPSLQYKTNSTLVSLLNNKTFKFTFDNSTNKSLLHLVTFRYLTRSLYSKQLLSTTKKGNQSTYPLRLLESANIKIEDISFTILIKNKNNTYSPARDTRIFATDGGFLEVKIKMKNYDSTLYEAKYFSIFLGKGITLLKDKLENNPQYEIILNSTCTNITFFDEFTIQNEYIRVLYVAFAPVYISPFYSRQNEQITFRSLVDEVIIGNVTSALPLNNSEAFLQFFEEGLRIRETINIDIKQYDNNINARPFIIIFTFELIFNPKLESHEHYYFSILRTKKKNEDAEADYSDEEWELIASCNEYVYDEYEYMITDCNETSIRNCPYYYKLELFYDKWNSQCVDGYLGTSNLVLFPINISNEKNEFNSINNIRLYSRKTKKVTDFPIIFSTLIIVVWFASLVIIVNFFWRIFIIINQNKQKRLKMFAIKEVYGERKDEDEDENNCNSQNCILKYMKE